MSDGMNQELRYWDLLNFCQFLAYHGGEAQLTVFGQSISRDQADVLVNAYLHRNVPNIAGAEVNSTIHE